MTPKIGLLGEVTLEVEPSMLATTVGSGELEVFATPRLIASMERAACRAVEGWLAEGPTTVGGRIDGRHLAATPLGARVHARAELIENNGRRLGLRGQA